MRPGRTSRMLSGDASIAPIAGDRVAAIGRAMHVVSLPLQRLRDGSRRIHRR